MAPSTPFDSPYIALAKKNKIPVTMWSSLFVQFAKDRGVKIVGITGTRGKTTTTEMIVHILKTLGMHVVAGGNLRGTSLLSNFSEISPNTVVVLELDSWKLQGFGNLKISPDISVFTTFFVDHMNYYKGQIKRYFLDKANIFKYQTKSDFLITGSQVVPYIKKWGGKIKSKIISPKDVLPQGYKISMLGKHNLYNASLAREVALRLGFKDASIKKALKSFKGVSGRMEFVGEVRGVKYYNDTAATTPEATLAALETLSKNKNVILLAGGSDKEGDVKDFIKKVPKYYKYMVLFSGTGTDKIKNHLSNFVEVDSMKVALTEAKQKAKKGDIVLLSPGFASFGVFKNQYDRGDQFVAMVKKLK
jgi:UDP-N-acetylmuramoylalanine--D-glutamate ligase